ncbi:MAG TPA: transaldolase family protein [Steroidobacteraceae bacterium]|nr:transaldolase family protein [Steroidobacteraceae bacterium]
MRIEVGGTRLQDLQRFGQSVWLDCHDPEAMAGSRLARLIRSGISGVVCTAVDLAGAESLDGASREARARLRATEPDARHMHEHSTVDDWRRVADQLRRVYSNTGGRDGYVNIELSPVLAHDADSTEFEARRLWSMIDRPNVLIKVPANGAGLIAMRRLIAAGISINATPIFGAHRYGEVIEAYMAGLEDRIGKSAPLDRVASVASIFVNEIDAAVDRELDRMQQPDKAVHASRLRSKAAVAVARLAYQRYKNVISSPRWRLLARYHAQTQRLLWAGTAAGAAGGTGLKYANELVGRDTIALMAPNAVDAYTDHGVAAPTLERNLPEVLEIFGELDGLGVDLERISAQLESASIRPAAPGATPGASPRSL